MAVLDGAEPGTAEIVLDRTPFYAESGGQVGDTGAITTETGRAMVRDTQNVLPGPDRAPGPVEGEIFPGQDALAAIDVGRRDATRRNHTGTHLLHAALRQVLGDHVRQQGSLWPPTGCASTSPTPRRCGPRSWPRWRRLANAEVLADDAVEVIETSKAEAEAMGALAFFGDKYGERVRVVRAGCTSTELCGGTHVDALGMIGPVTIVSEGSIGSNTRRIEAVTGAGSLALVEERRRVLDRGGPAAAGGARRRGRRPRTPARAPAPGGQGARSACAGRLARGRGRPPGAGGRRTASVVHRESTAWRPTSCATWPRPSRRHGAGGGRGGGHARRDQGGAWRWPRATTPSTPGPRSRSWPPLVGGGGGGSPELAVAGGSDPAKIDDLLAEAGAGSVLTPAA